VCFFCWKMRAVHKQQGKIHVVEWLRVQLLRKKFCDKPGRFVNCARNRGEQVINYPLPHLACASCQALTRRDVISRWTTSAARRKRRNLTTTWRHPSRKRTGITRRMASPCARLHTNERYVTETDSRQFLPLQDSSLVAFAVWTESSYVFYVGDQ